jgi:hypothetical protein
MKYLTIASMVLAIAACAEDPTPHFSNDTDLGDASPEPDTDCLDNGVCDSSPNDYCVNEDTLIIYHETYNCIDGECIYDQTLEECDWGCVILPGDDACHDPCDGVTCKMPDDECISDTVIKIYGGIWCEVDEYGDAYCEEDYTESDCTDGGGGCIVIPDADDECE